MIYLLCMGLKSYSAEGLVGPGIQAPPRNAYALDLEKKAGGNSPAALNEVQQGLTSAESLLKLNTAEEYAQLPGSKLALQPILNRLARNHTPGAREIIGKLCSSAVFLAEATRVECLLQVLPAVRPTPPEAVALLRKLCEPESDHLEAAIRALFDIGEKSTLQIFAAQASNPDQDAILVQGWMRDPLLRHRRAPAVLEMCLDLLKKPEFDPELKNSLVEVLFDYRPAEWYLSEKAGASPAPKPPTKESSPKTETLLHQIAAAIAADPAITPPNKALAAKAVREG
jgi:hypothetical protein